MFPDAPQEVSPLPPLNYYLTVSEAAQQLGIAPLETYRAITEGPLKACELDGALMVRSDWLEEYRAEP